MNTENKNLSKTKLIYYRITGLCNNNCPFCYREYRTKGDDFNTIIENLKHLKRLGFKVVAFLGGEITLLDNLYEILKESKNLGFINYVVTNGYKLNELLDKPNIKSYIDYVGLPLDGYDVDTVHQIRVIDEIQFNRTMKLFKRLDDMKIPYRISTIVNHINTKYLESIENFVYSELNLHPETWRLLPYLKLFNSDTKMELTNEDWSMINDFQKNNTHKISVSNSKYYILSKDNQLYLSDEENFNLIGNIRKIDSLSNNLNNEKWILDGTVLKNS